MSEIIILEACETRRSFGVIRCVVSVLLLGLPFLGRQKITLSDERVVVEQGFWTSTRDEVEIFRIRDIVSVQTLYQRILGIGDVVIRSTSGSGGGEQVHILRGVVDPLAIREAIRSAWNDVARPKTSANLD